MTRTSQDHYMERVYQWIYLCNRLCIHQVHHTTATFTKESHQQSWLKPRERTQFLNQLIPRLIERLHETIEFVLVATVVFHPLDTVLERFEIRGHNVEYRLRHVAVVKAAREIHEIVHLTTRDVRLRLPCREISGRLPCRESSQPHQWASARWSSTARRRSSTSRLEGNVLRGMSSRISCGTPTMLSERPEWSRWRWWWQLANWENRGITEMMRAISWQERFRLPISSDELPSKVLRLDKQSRFSFRKSEQSSMKDEMRETYQGDISRCHDDGW